MDGHEVDQIAHLAAPGGGHHLVGGQVHRVQDVAEVLIRYCGEKTEVAVHNPFQPGGGIPLGDFGCIDQGQLPQPGHKIPGPRQGFRVTQSGRRNPFLAVMENVDIAGIPKRVAVQGRAAGDVALRVPVRGKQAQNAALDFR